MTELNWFDPFEVVNILVKNALIEDQASCDAATDALGVYGEKLVICEVKTREPIIVAGIELAASVFDFLPGAVTVKIVVLDGNKVQSGALIASISGSVSSILRGERIFLNILGRLCGIATVTAEFVEECSGTGVEILDTRKTTPGMRALEKYAVKMGGGVNHRFSLADMAMLKDNHLAAIGGVNNLALVMERLNKSGVPVEIEVDSIEQFKTVLTHNPDRILLDNMTLAQLSEAVLLGKGTGIYLEASGGINLKTVKAVANTGVNGISVGKITHSVESSDIGLDWIYGGEKE